MKRRKLKKGERNLLWYESEGKCQLCGEPLDPDNWHADHIIPFVVTGKTNIHELQALCPDCNLKKGKLMLRQHQRKMMEICDQILAGQPIKEIICDITPGGGKSALPVILAHKLIPKRYDKLCWVVPRSSLRKQGESTFIQRFLRIILNHNCLIRQSTNDSNPSRDIQGHITTYQAIVQNPSNLAQEFDRHNYILFLDEPHHVAVDSQFEKALLPIVQRAGLVVYASGTLERGDSLPIAFLEYRQSELGLILDLTETDTRRVIRYPRRIALAPEEKAILPLEFEVSDSKAEWVDRYGNSQNIDTFYEQETDLGAALQTVLRTSFAFQLIDKCVNHWQGYKSHTYSAAKLLIVSPRIEVAKEYQNHLEKNLGVKSAIVHSKESDKETLAKIDQFKNGHLDALVTVAIAYEGLDVPEITHIACLTHYRSKPWLEQCFARANRISGNKERGFIFAPDDPDLSRVMESLRLEQESIARQINRDQDEDYGQDKLFKMETQDIVPQGSQLTGTRAVAPNLNESVDQNRYRAIELAREKTNLPNGLSTTELSKFLVEFGVVSLPDNHDDSNLNLPLITPKQQEENLLKSIETYARKVDVIYFSEAFGTTNKSLWKIYKKNRRNMTISELQNVWRFLQSHYPLESADDYKEH